MKNNTNRDIIKVIAPIRPVRQTALPGGDDSCPRKTRLVLISILETKMEMGKMEIIAKRSAYSTKEKLLKYRITEKHLLYDNYNFIIYKYYKGLFL